MVSIRLTDNAEIQAEGLRNILTFDNSTRRGNIVKKFKIVNGNTIEFFDEELEAKMIPKQNQPEVNGQPLCVVETKLGSIIFQNIGHYPKFLVMNDDGFFTQTDFFDLNDGDDEILCYDDITDDYVISEVTNVYLINNIDHEKQPLSNYALLSETGGIIVNNIMVI